MIKKLVVYIIYFWTIFIWRVSPLYASSLEYDNFFAEIIKKENKAEKDTYLLFDCLYDKDAENIDAYSLFLYMQDNGIKSNYVVLKESPLYEKLKKENKLDNIIGIDEYSKLNGWNFLQNIADVLPHTKAIITSFGTESVIDVYLKKLEYLKYIFIQHGQIYFKESVFHSGYLYPDKFPYILASSKIEEFILKKYGWNDQNIIKAGLPRWDLLKENIEYKQEKSIFIMFTWRNTSPYFFSETQYFNKLSSLLNSKKLHTFLKKHNIKVYFAPHHSLKTNSKINLDIEGIEGIEVIDTKHISNYIRKSSLLLTDFSSVSFDFMFQDKPVILYGLDRGDRLLDKNQYMDLELLYKRRNIFPNIVFDEDEAIELIKYYVKNDFKLQENIKQIYELFFYTKESIRKRLVDEIEKICKT